MTPNLAYVCADPGVPVFGQKGASVHVREMLRAFRRTGANTDLYTTRAGGDPPAGLADINVTHVPVAPGADTRSRERNALAASGRLAVRLAARSYDIVYERYSLWSHAPLERARVAGATTVLEVNSPLIEEQEKHRALEDRSMAKIVAKRAFVSADVIVAVSNEVAEWVRGMEPGSSPKIVVVPNAVDPARFTPRYMNPDGLRRDGPFAIGFVGTLKPWHGLESLIESFAILRERVEARLLIVGDGPEKAAVEERLAGLGLKDDVELTGSVDPDRVPVLLNEMDAAVAPYPGIPGFYFSPLKVFEYMAAGLPVVASSVGQIPQIVQNGVTGFLTPPGDVHALAAALERLATEPELPVAMGNAGRREVEAKHSWDRVAAFVLGLAKPGQSVAGKAS